MKKTSYISVRNNVTGFSFANLGIFTGLGGALVSAIYSLVLLDILGTSTFVGLYSSVYNIFGFIIALSLGEALRFFAKSKLFYASLLAVSAIYFMMGFGIKAQTFIMLDFFSVIPLMFIGTLIPLFMADFAGKGGIAGLSGRYMMWLHIGAVFAPMIAMSVAGEFGLRSVFMIASIVYLLALVLFKRYKIVEFDKRIPKLTPKRTINSIWRETRFFFKNINYARAYVTSFGCTALGALRGLYVPIIIIEAGFGKDMLGIILTIGLIPYILLAEPVGHLAKKYGKVMTNYTAGISLVIYSIIVVAMYFVAPWTMLILFVLLKIPASVQGTLHDLMFFNVAKDSDRSRYFSIFNTSKKLSRIFAPLLGAAFIVAFGSTSAIWLLSGVIGLLAAATLLWKK